MGLGDVISTKKGNMATTATICQEILLQNTKKSQEEVNTLLSYHFGEEWFRRHDPKNTMRDHFNKIGLPWEYTTISGRRKKCIRMPKPMMK
jgi:hypothetical protein